MAEQPAFRIEVDDSAVTALLTKMPGVYGTRLRQLVEGAAIDVQREMRMAAPVAVTGHLRRSINYSFSAALLNAEIMPDVPYAGDVEYGTGPHYVSAAPGSSLAAWARQKGLNPYAVAHSIAKKGTKKHPFIQPTYDKMKPKVERDIADGISQLITEATE